jgi:MFS superfamily sulfate permease-like transporter
MVPSRILGLTPFNLRSTELALAIGLLTIGTMLAWEKFRPARLSLLPGALLGVVAATLIAWTLGLGVARVDVPSSILASFALPEGGFFGPLAARPALLVSALVIAFIASAETLLSAAAVDRMHDGVRTDYNKELRAQGVGNLICGMLGALPMTGVIVRSSANVQAGAKTRASSVMHGVWILCFVALLPWLLREVPMAALGGVLVLTGWRLISLKHAKHLWRVHGVLPAAIWLVTFVLVVATDLLTGVLVGLGLSALELIPHLGNLRFGVSRAVEGDETRIEVEGAATFLRLPRLNAMLEDVPSGRAVHLDLANVRTIDHTTATTLSEWLARHRKLAEVTVTGSPSILRALA